MLDHRYRAVRHDPRTHGNITFKPRRPTDLQTMTPAKEQKHYAITQHALCCKYLDVAEPYDGDGDTLFEAVVALRKDRDECKGVTACSPSSTPEVDAITTDPATSSDYKASALGMLARKLTRERDEWRDAEAAANRCFTRANQQRLTLRACLEYIAHAGISGRHMEDEARKALPLISPENAEL